MPSTAAPDAAASAEGTAAPGSAGGAVQGPSFSPLYQQIKTLILRSLQSGEWRPGEAIPSEIELAARFKVSQGTVRKAIDELASENLLMRRQGKGTFVATHAEEQVQYRFLRLAPDQPSALPGTARREFLDCRRLRAPVDVARALQMKAGDMVVEVRRVLHFSGQPVVLDDIWLPGHLFKGLTADRLSEYRGPMYGLFESEFGVRMIRAEEKLRAVAADEQDARLLEVASGTPLLSVERLAFTYGDQPVELRRGLYRTDHHYYRNELS
ncbi:MAG: GntR family transcriptional regulator [Burkholderiales bacterium]|nr:MAG: GntR family transcriptional regulator [Burkholderiales bacterium]